MMNQIDDRNRHLYVSKLLRNYKKTANTLCLLNELQMLKADKINKDCFKEWMSGLMDSIGIMTKTTLPFLKELILDVPWHKTNKDETEAFYHLIMSLVTSHSDFTYEIIDCLFRKLCFDRNTFSDEDVNSNYPELVVQRKKSECLKISNLICSIVKAIPLMSGLGKMARNSRPSIHFAAVHQIMYLYNMLILSELLPSHRRTFLSEIFQHMIILDLWISPEKLGESIDANDDIFTMECDNDLIDSRMKNVVKGLDAMMIIMFKYIHSVMHGDLNIDTLFEVNETFSVNSCSIGSVSYANPTHSFSQGCECKRENQKENSCRLLYCDMRKIFMELILPTWSSHIQYLIFYVLAIRPTLIYDFIDLLKVNYEYPNNSLELGGNALAYIGSLLTRSKFIPFKVMYSCLENLSQFCLSYISQASDIDWSVHSVSHARFFYASQIIFYVFTFRYKEFTKDDKLRWARALRLDSIINSRLNPLRYCLSTVADKFAAVSYHFQLVYCYTIMERNSSVSLFPPEKNNFPILDFQPYDPYLLPRSASCVSNHYVEFSGFDDEIKMKPNAVNVKRERTDSSSYNFLSCSPDVKDFLV